MHTSASPSFLRGLIVRGAVLLALAGLLSGLTTAPASARPAIKWDSDGMADISAPPFTFSLELAEYSSPSEITQRADVRVDIGADVDGDPCAATIKVTPVQDGIPVGEAAYLDAVDSFDYVAVWLPVMTPGTYSLQIDGSVETGSYPCSPGSTTSTPYTATIDLFTIDKTLPGPASTHKVGITSTGPHTLVANTWGKSRPIRIAFTIKDPAKRSDLVHSICMQDTDDCWFYDAALKPRSYIRKTTTGWVRTWDFWWERASPADCLEYYWYQPDVSVILVVSNRDGRVIGRKKHTVKLTCRP